MRIISKVSRARPRHGEGDLDIRDFYRQVSSQYYRETFEETCTLSSVTRKVRTRRVVEMLDRHLPIKSILADLGCGPAQFAEPLLERGHSYVGIDISAEMYREMAMRLLGSPRATFLTGSVEKIPLPDSSVDAAICIGVVEYLRENHAALAEIYRILKRPGVAIFTFPNLRYPIYLLRTGLRPVLAPVLRMIAPDLRDTVYVSGITHRNLWPHRFLREAVQCGFTVRERCSHGYYPRLFNHRVPSLRFYLLMERWGERFLPGMGANYIVCLNK
ncbi:MAG: hypothetical protein AUH69_12840 [Actinobacteria bacterium 13_1_40CM_4_65_12]|nr:MAG: hypothetical protein AUH69_12840 [Actinobacteria bacterium 13_1_40CM_4_65_12]